tara:strand:+ start:1986 stop:2354 length:369 start_codon:yes stop_codon:yes gene_type:complete
MRNMIYSGNRQQAKVMELLKIGDVFERINYFVKVYRLIKIEAGDDSYGKRYLVESVYHPEIKMVISEYDLLRNDGVKGKREGFIPYKVLELEKVAQMVGWESVYRDFPEYRIPREGRLEQVL